MNHGIKKVAPLIAVCLGSLPAGYAAAQAFGFEGTYASTEIVHCASSPTPFAARPGIEATDFSTNITNVIEGIWVIRPDGSVTKTQKGVFLVGSGQQPGLPPGGTWSGVCSFTIGLVNAYQVQLLNGSCTDSLTAGFDHGTVSTASNLNGGRLSRGLVPGTILISDVSLTPHVLNNPTTGNTFHQLCGGSGSAIRVR